MEAFEITYNDETKQWVKRQCVKPREIVPERRPRISNCALAAVTFQAFVGLWLLSRWRS